LIAELDRPSFYTEADPHALRELLRALPGQLEEAARRAERLDPAGDPPRAMLILGMGGSAVAGDLVRELCRDRAGFPIEVCRGYAVPAWVGPSTIVVASSYSGRTEETLSGFAAARRRGSRCVAVTSGGDLARLATRGGIPWVPVPAGFPPRAALAYLMIPLVILLENLGVELGGARDRGEAVDVLGALGSELEPGSPLARNPAKQLAAWLVGRAPVIYGGDTTGAVAYRWRTQLEENAKVLAVSGTLPEMNHNAIEAWAASGAGEWAVMLLRDATEHPRVARRMELTRQIIESRHPTRETWSRGTGCLARVLSLVLVGDWVSYYLALLRGVDPWNVQTLEGFKRRLGSAATAVPPDELKLESGGSTC
jgi:glucose/mannose-6-phosphate isomerase